MMTSRANVLIDCCVTALDMCRSATIVFQLFHFRVKRGVFYCHIEKELKKRTKPTVFSVSFFIDVETKIECT